jgi:hypothetical protein
MRPNDLTPAGTFSFRTGVHVDDDIFIFFASHVSAPHQMAVPLPPEIVSHIFLSCIPDDNGRVTIGPLAMPLVLSGVCTQWRDVALSMPSLWTHIEIERQDKKLELFKRWLARTDTRPISVRFSFPAWKYPRFAWQFIDTLRDHCAQWEDVDIYIPDRVVEEKVQLEGSFPALRRLSIELSDPEYWYSLQWPRCQDTLADFQDAPVLKDVKLVHWYHTADVILPWSNLTILTLQSCCIGVPRGWGALAIFHLCQNLAKCTLENIRWDLRTTESPPTTFHSAPRLQELYLYSEMVNLWQFFRFPNLKRFRLPCGDEHLDLHSCHFAVTHSPSLDYLCLSIEGYLNAPELLPLVHSVPPGIRELKIEYTAAMNFSIEPVLHALRDEAQLLPHLTTFELHPSDGARAFPYALLVEMLSARSKGGALRYFTIIVDEDVDETVKAQFLALAEEGVDSTVAFNA